jgi:mRNA interferase MazF
VSLRRGDIVLVDFEPARPSEANKIRPAIIITNDQANRYATNVMVVPLTSNVATIYPFQLFLPADETGLVKDSKAQVELMRSVSRTRLGKQVASLPQTLQEALDDRLKLHLDLS